MRNRYPAFVIGVIVGLTPSGSAQGPKSSESKSLVRGRAYAESGRVDLFVASSAAWELPAEDDRNWNPALKLALQLALDGGLKEWPPNDMPKAFLSMDTYRAHRWEPKPVFLKQDRPYQPPDTLADGSEAFYWTRAILSPGVSLPHLHSNIILSRGDVKARRSNLTHSVVFATGDVTVGTYLGNAILVCDGDVTVGEFITRALVVARGNIHVKAATYESVLVAGGKVTIEKPKRIDPEQQSKIKEDEKFQLGAVKFFELSRLGVKVSAADKVVCISAVADAKTFAIAGAKVGDVVESVNGKKPDSPESLRRLLRDALAVGDAAVTVRRGDATHTLKVTLPD